MITVLFLLLIITKWNCYLIYIFCFKKLGLELFFEYNYDLSVLSKEYIIIIKIIQLLYPVARRVETCKRTDLKCL